MHFYKSNELTEQNTDIQAKQNASYYMENAMQHIHSMRRISPYQLKVI